MSFAVHHPGSIAEAVALAHQFGEAGCFLAGGTDLIIQIHRRRQAPAHLIDLAGLHDLARITEEPNSFTLGALTTHKTIERCPAFQTAFVALVEAARVVGGHQVRNVATVGGNLANASPAADVVVPLLALDAEIALVGPDSARSLQLAEFLRGPGETARRHDELLQHVRISKLPPNSATAFLKFGRRKAMEISVVCVATRLTLDAPGQRCSDVRIALGAVHATALRVRAAESALEGREPAEQAFRAAGRIAAAACQPIDDVRASARYRRLLVEALVPRALQQSLTRIREVQP